jgi:putative PIN family toxin of toxin-antitoxin system
MSHTGAVRRVVLDTSVIVAAFRSRLGASNALLGHVAERRLIPLATPGLFLEYEAVMKRPEQRQATGLTIDQVDDVLAILASAIEPVDVRFTWRPQLADPADEMVLEAAVNGRAEAIVTHNLSDFAGVAPRFGIAALTPGAALRRLSR